VIAQTQAYGTWIESTCNVNLHQRFSIHFEVHTLSGRKNNFWTPCTIWCCIVFVLSEKFASQEVPSHTPNWEPLIYIMYLPSSTTSQTSTFTMSSVAEKIIANRFTRRSFYIINRSTWLINYWHQPLYVTVMTSHHRI